MNRLFVPMIALLALAACRAEAPASAQAPVPTEPVAAETVPAAAVAETTMAEPGVQPDAAANDIRALAGSYSGLLPCADCPGIDETLVLDSDGGFVLTDTYRERPGAVNVVQGSWSIEPDGKRIRLDPGNKQDADQFFEIESNALVRLDTEGKPIDSPFNMRLARDR